MGANSDSCSARSRSVSVFFGGGSAPSSRWRAVVVVARLLAQAVPALFGDRAAELSQPHVVRDEHVRRLAPAARRSSAPAARPPGERTARSPCWSRTRRPAAAGCRPPRRPCAPPRSRARCRRRSRPILSDAVGSSDVAMVGVTPRRASSTPAIALACSWSIVMTSPAALRIARAQVHQLRVGLRQHRRHPLPLDGEGGAQSLAGELARQPVVERGLVFDAVRRRPLHAPVDAREVHRAHHAPVLQGVAVAVFEVGLRQIAVVVDERDRPLVGSERRPRQAEAPPRRVERLPGRRRPRRGCRRRGGSRRGSTSAPRTSGRSAAGDAATCWYVTTTPCASGGSPP